MSYGAASAAINIQTPINHTSKDIMHQTKSILFIGLAALGLALAAPAQTNAPAMAATNAAPTEGTFLNTAFNYFTAFNTNLDGTFGAHRGSLFTGVDSIQGAGVNMANSIGLSYDLYAGTNNLRLSAESVTRNSGVAGTLLSEQVGLGVSFIVHDAKITAYADGGYWIYDEPDRYYAEIGLRAQKALTEHTYAWVAAAAQLPGNRQVFSAGVGITF